MLTSLLKRMIILFLILYTTVASLMNGTSPLKSTMNLLGYEPIESDNSTALKSTVTSLMKSTAKNPEVHPKQVNYVTKHITSCPEVGYFFKREHLNSVDASQCYLCFCSDPKWAICWPRENKRCDNEHYHHHGVGKRDVRTRRSPGFSDIFFRDASLDIFNKNTPEQCKPHESSYSEGCPPADWCIGCTVCDCDSNGRWDCHTLSFCPDQEAKKGNDAQVKPSKKHFRKKKKKIYKERVLTNVTSSKKNIGKGISKTTPTGSSEPKTASTKSEKKVMAHKKGPQLNQPVKKKFKKKNEYQMPENKPAKKNTTQVVMMPSKNKREVKKNIKKTSTVSKNNSEIIKKNDSKKISTITKNKSTITKSEKLIPPKNNLTIKGNLVKKTKPVTKEVIPKNTTEAKENLMESLRQKPKRSPLSLSAKKTKQIKKPVARKVNSKNLKDTKEPNTKKMHTNKNKKKKHNPADMKNKKNPKGMKNENKDKTESSRKSSNLTAEIIKDVEAKRMNRKARKFKRKRSSFGKGIQSDVLESTNDKKRVKRHVTDFLDSSNTTEVIYNRNEAVTKIIIDKETVTKPVIDIGRDNNILIDPVTYKSSTIDVHNVNETGNSFFNNNNENIQNLSTENVVTMKSSIQYNRKDNSMNPNVTTIETTTSMDMEPTVSLSSYYMYSVDDTVKTTPEFNKTFTAKRSLSESSNLNNESYATKEIDFKVLHLTGTSVYTTEPLIVSALNKITAQQSTATFKYTQKSKDTIQKSRFGDIESKKTEVTPKLETRNLTTENLNRRPKMCSSELTRKIGSTEKKYRLKKIVHVYNRDKTRLDDLNLPNHKKKNITNENLSSLQNFIKNHIKLFHRRNSTKKSGTHNVKVVTYLKKFFKKILTNQKKHKTLLQNDTSALTINKSKFIKTLCETFGPCYLNEQKRLLLNTRIDDLVSETNKMFRTIKILKGLLKLLDLDKNNKGKKMSKEENDTFKFSVDMHRLGSILRESYAEEQKGNLTTTELNQINYVKRNMQFFAQSTASFAKILNEIIDFLTIPGNASGLFETYSKDLKIKSDKRVDTFQKLKSLLISYKLLQNRFLQKMYEILGHVYPVKSDKKISADVKANNTATLHVYTKNIIKNLRKLKNLAQVALSKTTKGGRKRRDTRNDDSMEYLLVLMESLLKHSYQTDSVTDGIDLLIDAIKNAPDIKLVRKEVLQKHLVAYNTSNTEFVENKLFNHSNANTVTERNKNSPSFNNTSKQEDSQTNTIDSVDNESDFEYLPVVDRRLNNEITFTTVLNDNISYNKEQTTEDTAILELSSAKPLKESSMSPVGSSLKTILLDEYNKNFDKFMNTAEGDEFEKRMEIFSSELDDETLTTSTTPPKHKKKYNKLMIGTNKVNTNDATHGEKETDLDDNLKNELKDMSLSTSESKSSNKFLDWLDETFEEEIKDIKNTQKVKPLMQTLPTQEIVLKRRQDKSNQIKDVSLSDETYNNKKRDIDDDDKIYKKEMNLLNSINDNFGTSESDGLDSKDTFELHTD